MRATQYTHRAEIRPEALHYEAHPFRWLAAGWRHYAPNSIHWAIYTVALFAFSGGAWFIPVPAVNILVMLTCIGIGMAGVWSALEETEKPGGKFWQGALRPLDDFGQAVAVQVVATLFVGLSSLLFLLPGGWVAMRLRLAMPLSFLKKIPFWSAFSVSYRLSAQKQGALAAFDLLCLAVLALGAGVAGIGILIAFPWVMAARYAAFQAMTQKVALT